MIHQKPDQYNTIRLLFKKPASNLLSFLNASHSSILHELKTENSAHMHPQNKPKYIDKGCFLPKGARTRAILKPENGDHMMPRSNKNSPSKSKSLYQQRNAHLTLQPAVACSCGCFFLSLVDCFNFLVLNCLPHLLVSLLFFQYCLHSNFLTAPALPVSAPGSNSSSSLFQFL